MFILFIYFTVMKTPDGLLRGFDRSTMALHCIILMFAKTIRIRLLMTPQWSLLDAFSATVTKVIKFIFP